MGFVASMRRRERIGSEGEWENGRAGEWGKEHMAERINTHKELRVYQNAMEAAMEIFSLTKSFPTEEKYSMVDQIRRSSRSVCANIAEAWRKRRYKAAFVAKLNDVPRARHVRPRCGLNLRRKSELPE